MIADRVSHSAFRTGAAKKVLAIDHIEHHLETAAGPLSEAGREELARTAALANYL